MKWIIVPMLLFLTIPLCSCNSAEKVPESPIVPQSDIPKMTAAEVCTYVDNALNAQETETTEYNAIKAVYLGGGDWKVTVTKKRLSPHTGTFEEIYYFDEDTAEVSRTRYPNLPRHLQ